MLIPSGVHAADYYLDSVGGNDSSAGTSEGAAWRTTEPLADVTFSAGDTIHFKRGSTFDLADSSSGYGTEGIVLSMSESGNSSSPITFTSYGSGARPILSNARTGDGNSVFTLRGSYIVVEGLE